MKFTDNLLMIAAGYSLYTIVVVLSTRYFADINQLIPDVFSESVSITIGQTFHIVIASIVTGMLLVRFASLPILMALLVAIAINIESYYLLISDNSAKKLIDYYIANPTAFLNLIKPIVILPLLTYLLSLIRRIEPEEDN